MPGKVELTEKAWTVIFGTLSLAGFINKAEWDQIQALAALDDPFRTHAISEAIGPFLAEAIDAWMVWRRKSVGFAFGPIDILMAAARQTIRAGRNGSSH